MIIWIIGMSAAGKTAVAKELYPLIKNEHKNTVLIDGDIFRDLHDNDVDHSVAGRKKNSDRLCAICNFLDKQNIHVVCAVLSIFHEAQQWNRDNYKDYFEIYLDVPFNILTERDPKGLYKAALKGEMPNMVGVDIEFKSPKNPDLVIRNDGSESPKAVAERIFKVLQEKNFS